VLTWLETTRRVVRGLFDRASPFVGVPGQATPVASTHPLRLHLDGAAFARGPLTGDTFALRAGDFGSASCAGLGGDVGSLRQWPATAPRPLGWEGLRR